MSKGKKGGRRSKRSSREIRIFCCPVCGGIMYAPKKSCGRTVIGHKKKLWCPYCRREKNFEQIE